MCCKEIGGNGEKGSQPLATSDFRSLADPLVNCQNGDVRSTGNHSTPYIHTSLQTAAGEIWTYFPYLTIDKYQM